MCVCMTRVLNTSVQVCFQGCGVSKFVEAAVWYVVWDLFFYVSTRKEVLVVVLVTECSSDGGCNDSLCGKGG